MYKKRDGDEKGLWKRGVVGLRKWREIIEKKRGLCSFRSKNDVGGMLLAAP